MGPASLITNTAVSLMAAALFSRRSRTSFLGELDAVRYQALLGPDGEVAEAMGASSPAPADEDSSPLAELEAPLAPASVIPPLTFAPGQDLSVPPAEAVPAASPAPTHELPGPVDLAGPRQAAPGAPHPTRPQEVWHRPVTAAAVDGPAMDATPTDGREIDSPPAAGSPPGGASSGGVFSGGVFSGGVFSGSAVPRELVGPVDRPAGDPDPSPIPSRLRLARLLPFAHGVTGPEALLAEDPNPHGAESVDDVDADADAEPTDPVEELLALFDRPPVGLPDGSPVEPWAPALSAPVGALAADPVDRRRDERDDAGDADGMDEPPWAELDRLAADALPPEPEPLDAEPPWAERDRTAPPVPLAYLEVDDAVPPPWVSDPEDARREDPLPEPLTPSVDGTVALHGGHLRLAPHLGHDPRRTTETVVLDVATGWCWTALGAAAEAVHLVLPTGTVDVSPGTTTLTVLEPDGSSFVVVVAGEAALVQPGGRLRLRRGAMALLPLDGELQVDVASVDELASDPLVAHNLALDAAR